MVAVVVVVFAAFVPVVDVLALADASVSVVVVAAVLAVAAAVSVFRPVPFVGEVFLCVLPHTASVSLFWCHLHFAGHIVVFLVVLVFPAAFFRPWSVLMRALLLFFLPWFRSSAQT